MEVQIINSYNPGNKTNNKNNDLVNNRIPFKEVLVIDSNGENLGVLSRKEALIKAEEQDLDLYCVSPQAKPPVCKIIDYAKFRFDQQKMERSLQKNQKGNQLKEIKFTPMTADHDLEVKAKQATKFLEKGCKLKVSVFMKGRMQAKPELAYEVLNKFCDMIKDFGFIEKQPQIESKYCFCYVSANSKK